MKLKFSTSVTLTPAFAIIAEGWNEMVQDFLTPEGVGFPPFAENSRAVYAENTDDEIVGVIVWNIQTPNSPIIEIQMAYVEPTSRRRKVFRTMLDGLVKHVSVMGVDQIRIAVLPGNEIAEQVVRALGWEPLKTVYACQL